MLDDKSLKSFINKFFGYGDLNASIWFIGMEEGGGKCEKEIANRLAAWVRRGKLQVDDLAQFHHEFGDSSRFIDGANIQTTWKELIRVMLLLEGKPSDRETIRNYQINELGRMDGAVALLELMPLPKPSVKSWPYDAWTSPDTFPELRSIAAYETAVRPNRIDAIRKLIQQHAPKVVVFYGKKFKPHWESICGGKFQANDFPMRLAAEPTTFMLLPHPATFGGRATPHYEAAAATLKSAMYK